MIEIYFYCPTHLREIDVGIEVDKDTFERTRLNVIHVPCPHCGQKHRFLMADSHNTSFLRVQFSAPRWQVPARPSLGVPRPGPVRSAAASESSAQPPATTSHGFAPALWGR
jgi:hypothetical protein